MEKTATIILVLKKTRLEILEVMVAADQVQTMKIQINQNKLTTKDAIIFAVVIGIFGICCICGA